MGGRVPAKRPAAKGASEVGQTSNDHQAHMGSQPILFRARQRVAVLQIQ